MGPPQCEQKEIDLAAAVVAKGAEALIGRERGRSLESKSGSGNGGDDGDGGGGGGCNRSIPSGRRQTRIPQKRPRVCDYENR